MNKKEFNKKIEDWINQNLNVADNACIDIEVEKGACLKNTETIRFHLHTRIEEDEDDKNE